MHCYQIVNTPSAIGSGRYSCNRSFGVRAQWFFILCPPNVLYTGSLFLNRGVPGTPQAKDKILVRTLSKYGRKSIISYKWPLVPFQVWPLRSICKARKIVFPCVFAPHFFFFFTPCLLCCVVLLFSCAGDAHIADLSQVFTHPNKTSVIKKLDLRYVNVIIISAKNGRLTYV